MKLKIAFVFIIFPIFLYSQQEFKKYFQDNSLRFDFILAGDFENVQIYPQELKKEPYWGGSKKNLIDTFNYGAYRYTVYDLNSGKLIFSRGFSTLFQEWQTTDEAKNTKRSYYHTAVFPFPRNKIKLNLKERQWNGTFKTIYSTEINPNDYHIKNEKVAGFEIENILLNGKPEKKVDIAIIAEGYTSYEKNNFIDDVNRLINHFFKEPPFKKGKNKFNIRAIFVASVESGTDMPRDGIYKNTFFNSTFNTFDLPRYLTSSDIKNIYDAASIVPYDQVVLLVNSERYGGGGFYNYLSVCTSDNELSENVFLHEFGHSFAGLGDEYYTSDVAYDEFYNLDIEPWEPNLTTLINFEKKWGTLVNDSIPVPTPRKWKYRNHTGVFEGGGYTSKGMYSPMMDCKMKSNEAKHFCPTCQKAIKDIIDFYTE